MIDFYSETEFKIESKRKLSRWIKEVVQRERNKVGEITYIYCDDQYLLKLNKKFLNHDTLTDIITFDNSVGDRLSGDIYISVERVRDNTEIYTTSFIDELNRVMIHGILHLCGYRDKSEADSKIMRSKEDEALELLNTL